MNQEYYDIYMKQFFTVLGQTSALMVSSLFAVPMFNYYTKMNFRSFYYNLVSVLFPEELRDIDNTEFDSLNARDFEVEKME
jgi:hypothetical protein